MKKKKKKKKKKEKAVEKDLEIEETLRGLRAERDNALAGLDQVKEKRTKLKEEDKREADGLKKDTASQLKAWQEKEKKWEEGMANDKKRHKRPLIALTWAQNKSWRVGEGRWRGWSRRRRGQKRPMRPDSRTSLNG